MKLKKALMLLTSVGTLTSAVAFSASCNSNEDKTLETAKASLKTTLDRQSTELGKYSDSKYSTIKSQLSTAFQAAQNVYNNKNATAKQLQDAQKTLQAAINKAIMDKSSQDSTTSGGATNPGTSTNPGGNGGVTPSNPGSGTNPGGTTQPGGNGGSTPGTATPGGGSTQPGNSEGTPTTPAQPMDSAAKMALKTVVDTKTSKLGEFSAPQYSAIKTRLEQAFTTAENTLNAANSTDQQYTDAKNTLNAAISSATTTQKQNIDEYANFKLFAIDSANFHGDFAQTQTAPSTQNIVGYSSNYTNNPWKYAKRTITGHANATNVAWIYNLGTATGTGKTTATYKFNFTYYGSTATLYFPYKTYSTTQTSSNLGLQYTLNDSATQQNIAITDATLNGIKVAKVTLNNLNFGNNTITFSVPSGKQNPMIGNMYIASTDTTQSAVYNDMFGNSASTNNPNQITVNIAKGYGLANSTATTFTTINGKADGEATASDHYLLKTLGGKAGNVVRYYTFYVNVPQTGTYNISGIYNNQGNSQGMWLWAEKYGNKTTNNKGAKFGRFQDGGKNNNNTNLRTFSTQNNRYVNDVPAVLNLTQGLNTIVVSGPTESYSAPSLGNVTFTLQTPAATSGSK